MQKFILSLIVSIVIGFAGWPVAPEPANAAKDGPSPPDHPRQLRLPPPGPVRLPQATRATLSNGLRVEMLPYGDTPLIHLSLLIRAGSRWDPPGKVGLAYVTANALQPGGTVKISGNQFNRELERHGATLQIEPSDDSVMIRMSVLRDDFRDACLLFAGLLSEPAFPVSFIDGEKQVRIQSLKREEGNPTAVVVREFWQLLFGTASPYVRRPSAQTIAAITRVDALAYQQNYLRPENAVLGVWGTFDTKTMVQELEQSFQGWQGQHRPQPELPAWAVQTPKARVYLVDRDIPEPWFLIGRRGGMRSDAGHAAMMVLNSVFGDGLSSRIVRNIRSEKGLSYVIGSQWNAGWDRPGVFTVMGGARPEKIVECIRAVRESMEGMILHPITEAEFHRAVRSVEESVIAQTDSPKEWLDSTVRLSFFNYPTDYTERYLADLRQLRLGDVQELAAKYLRFEDFIVVVIGDEHKFDAPLSTFGPVQRIANDR